ncbi:MAG: protein DpdD [Planctomycetia bacterium]
MTPSDLQEFLERFFGEGNAIRWSQYLSSTPGDAIRILLEPWISRFQKQQSPFCLPRVNASSHQTTWYVLCTNSRQARSVRETLQAFIGPTYANFNGEFATLSSADPIEQLCEEHFRSLVFQLPVVDLKARPRVNSLLSRMIEFRDRDSSRSLGTIKPIGRLFRDVEMAIIAGNEDSANRIYAEIRSRGRLSATNLAFLQVRILTAFNHWAEILNMPSLNDLLQVHRPKRVSEHLATAAYQQFFLQYEELKDVRGAIASFQSIGERYHGLVRSTECLQSADAIKFAVLAATAATPPNRQLAERLIKSQLLDEDRPWCKALLSKLEAPSKDNAVAETVAAFDLAEMRYSEGNFDEAFALYLEESPTYRAVCRVLEIAVEIDTTTAAKKAIQFVESASNEIQGKILGRRVCTNQIETLTSILGQSVAGNPKPITSLFEWFQCVDYDNHSANLTQVLEYGLPAWLSEPTFNAAEVGELLRQSRTSIPAETIRNSVPVFIHALLIDNVATRENKPIYNALIELLIYDEMIGADDLCAVEQLLEAILTIAPSHVASNNDFVFAVDVTKYLWETVAAPRHLDWALSTLDLLIDTGVHQHANLSSVLAAITNSSRAWIRRVSDDQWSLLELLATDLGLGSLLEGIRTNSDSDSSIETTSIRDALNGKSVAVYSLTERIARRFGQLAEQKFDGIKLHYIHDKSLTDRMKGLAQSVDIFIVNTLDATHAATIGIKQNRSTSAITIEPTGKSALSMANRLFTYATGLK